MSKETKKNEWKEMLDTFHPIDGTKMRSSYAEWVKQYQTVSNYVLLIAFFILLLLIIFNSHYQKYWFTGMIIVVGLYGRREGHSLGYRDGYQDGRDEGIDTALNAFIEDDELKNKSKK